MENKAMGDKQIDSNNLKVIKDQMAFEALANKKCSEFSNLFTDTSLKTICTDAACAHKNNFNSLKTYLDSHQ